MSNHGSVTIRVRGSHRVKVAPERGTVHAVVAADGPESDPVLRRVEEVLQDLAEGLRGLAEDGRVARWSSGQVQVSAHRPWNESGTQLPLVHQARVEVVAEFAAAADLAAWLVEAVDRGAAVEWVQWSLTDERRAVVERKVRQAAVYDAVARARDYADALDLGSPRIVTIADTGLLPSPQPEMRMMASYQDEARPGLVVEPTDIEVVAEVEAEFAVPPS